MVAGNIKKKKHKKKKKKKKKSCFMFEELFLFFGVFVFL